jgi:hypothetical protein
MAQVIYDSTVPVQGDTFNTLLAKLAQEVGAEPASGDSDYNLVWKILEELNGGP